MSRGGVGAARHSRVARGGKKRRRSYLFCGCVGAEGGGAGGGGRREIQKYFTSTSGRQAVSEGEVLERLRQIYRDFI